ncbi:MAG TPA: AprI/Inh family metalloprotease inhibitor [Pseudolabrys sp.]|jgi:hypothetical protein|nr:AprI/Inh family metalloprotease inhibitor [Pseudolabrys sp.]
MKRLGIAGGLIITLTLAGCAGQQSFFTDTEAAAPPQQQVDMAGRWRISVPRSPACGMHFGGGPGIKAGPVQPEGGCPGKFFTARHWEMTPDGQTLTLDDFQMTPLAQFERAGARFTGRTAGGQPVTLARFPASASAPK